MEPSDRSKWLPRLAVAAIVTVLLVVLVGTWSYSNVLRDELVAIDRSEVVRDVEVVTVGSGRIVVARTPITETEGIWGVDGENGYGQASVLISTTADTVERAFRSLEGSLDAGDLVAFDPVAYPGDPLEAHGIDFEEVRFTGELGVYPAWVIDGASNTWVVIVHGAAPDQRTEALRLIPGLVAQRYPVMVMTVRGDVGAPATTTGLRTLGTTEWRDLAAAVDYGFTQNADEFILLGFDVGANTVANFLHEADDISAVRGVVFDSALYSPERIADRLAADRNVLAPMRGAGKLLASIRFDLDWGELDQIERAGEYTVPVLVLHGSNDATVPIAEAVEFFEAVGSLAELVEINGGTHAQLWNADPTTYDTELLEFIDRVRTGE